MSTRLLAALLLVCAAAASAQDRRALVLEHARMLAALPSQQVGEAGPGTLQRADQIASGTLFFYGTTPVQVGLRDIDWRGRHVKHQEWPAQLNRFHQLEILASAYKSTRDERYARAARAYIEDWLRGHDYASASSYFPGDSSLNMSIRLGTGTHPGWGGTLPVFLSSPAFDDAFLERILTSIGHQAVFLSQHLATTRNWRMSQFDTLVLASLRFPFLPGAPKLLRTGTLGMRNCIRTQFLPDGVHIERTPGYADWMTRVAANFFQLAKLFPEVDARVDADMVVRALDYGAHAELSGVNDSSAPHRDPRALVRLAERAAILRRLGLDGKYPAEPALAQVFPAAGQVFVRSAWKPGADYLAFDASTWGGDHCHLSRNAFSFRSGGRVLVADPAIISYEMSDPLGPYGKSTAAHSTLNINGWNQSGADGKLLCTEFTNDIVLIHGRYQGGYWEGPFTWGFTRGVGRGVYGEHDRVLFWVKGEYLLALDTMAADAGADIRNVWQMGPMEKWSHDPASLAWWSGNSDMNVLVRLIGGPKATMECWQGSREPLRGWLGQSSHEPVAAPQVEFRYTPERNGAVTSAVLVVPFRGSEMPAYKVESAKVDFTRIGEGSVHHIRLALPGGGADEIAWSSGLALPVDDGRPFTTDGVFVWRRTGPDGKETKRYIAGGTYLE